jgi:hypothetical protein
MKEQAGVIEAERLHPEIEGEAEFFRLSPPRWWVMRSNFLDFEKLQKHR